MANKPSAPFLTERNNNMSSNICLTLSFIHCIIKLVNINNILYSWIKIQHVSTFFFTFFFFSSGGLLLKGTQALFVIFRPNKSIWFWFGSSRSPPEMWMEGTIGWGAWWRSSSFFFPILNWISHHSNLGLGPTRACICLPTLRLWKSYEQKKEENWLDLKSQN